MYGGKSRKTRQRDEAIKSTIDRSGRIVIPRSLREAAALEPGTDVVLRVTGGKLEITASAVVERRRLARRGRIGKRALKSA